jgi:ferredoxin
MENNTKEFSFLEKIILKVIKYKISKWFSMEKSLYSKDNFIKPSKLSPKKTWPNPEKIPLGGEIPFSLKNYKTIGKFLRSSVSQGMLSIKSLKNNHADPTPEISPQQLKDFELKAKEYGVKAIAYTKIPPELIFQQRAINYDNAIVLIMEMDRSKIAKAPSLSTFKMVFQTYDELGIATNKLTELLRKNNFNAHGSHPLGGLVLYPPLAKKAGLGWLGKHGLLITPQCGSRQRISAIFTNIQNLPFSQSNEHEWIEKFCESCNICIKICPPKAILKTPIIHPSKRETHLDRSKCLPYFVNNHGCSICLKVCPFSNKEYHKIKDKFHQSEE